MFPVYVALFPCMMYSVSVATWLLFPVVLWILGCVYLCSYHSFAGYFCWFCVYDISIVCIKCFHFLCFFMMSIISVMVPYLSPLSVICDLSILNC
jgi:hypothetical protein